MWLFTKYGFFSVVCGRRFQGLSPEPDPNTVMLRARQRSHLENLLRRFATELGAAEIHASRDTDYRYRIVVPKSAFGAAMAGLADELDYTNFKSEVGRCGAESAYLHALHEVWEVMYGLQTKE